MADSDEGEDGDETEDGAQGVGLISHRNNKRIEGDALRYSGMDKGDRGDNTALRRGGYSYNSDDSDEDDWSEDDLADAGLAALSPAERDEVLVQSAFRQIQKAQERGRADVQLTKDELAALERRRKRMEEEEAARKAARRKAKAQRISVPLAQLEPATRKKKKAPAAQDLGSTDETEHVGYPPMGYFPPPKSRPPSGPQQSPNANQNSRGSSPFQYSHANSSQPPSGQSSSRTPAARARAQVEESDSSESSDGSSPPRIPGALDPFKYQVSGPRQTQAASASASTSRRNPGTADVAYAGPTRSTSGKNTQVTPTEETSDGTSEEDSEEVQIVSPPQRRTRNTPVVVQEERGRKKEKEEKAKKAQSSPAKTSGGPSTRRRKKRK